MNAVPLKVTHYLLNQEIEKQPPEMFFKKRCSKKFRKIHRKTPVPGSLFYRPATLLKMRLWHRCFPMNFAKFLGTPFSLNTSGRLLLETFDKFQDIGLQ